MDTEHLAYSVNVCVHLVPTSIIFSHPKIISVVTIEIAAPSNPSSQEEGSLICVNLREL